MSIINQVLAQLERRGVQVEQDMVRVVQPQRSGRRLPLLLVALLLAGAAWWLARGSAAGGAKPQQVAMTAPVLPAMQPQISGVAAQDDGASRVSVAIPSASVAAPAVALPQAPKPVLQVQKPAPQTTLKSAPPEPVPQSAPLPKVVASVTPKQSVPQKPAALAVLEKVKPGAMAAQSTVVSAPSKPVLATQGKAKPLAAAPSANKTVPPKPQMRPDKRQLAAAATPAADEMPMKQISRSQQADAEFRKGVALMQQGRSSEAIASYQAALQLDGGHDAARQSLVALLLEDKRRDDAERLLQERLEDRPQHTGFAMLLARLQVERGATGEALVTLERSLAYAEAKAEYLAFLAALQQRNNLHADAATHYQAALQLQPGNGAWLMGYGISLQALRRTEEAKVAYQKALDSKTLSPDLQAFVQRKLKGL